MHEPIPVTDVDLLERDGYEHDVGTQMHDEHLVIVNECYINKPVS